jgi:hypothetical protein
MCVYFEIKLAMQAKQNNTQTHAARVPCTCVRGAAIARRLQCRNSTMKPRVTHCACVCSYHSLAIVLFHNRLNMSESIRVVAQFRETTCILYYFVHCFQQLNMLVLFIV